MVPQLLQLQGWGQSGHFHQHRSGGDVKRPTWSLLGRPAIMTEKLPPLGTTRRSDPDRSEPVHHRRPQQIEIAASEHVNFLANQMTWRVVERVDGQPWMDKPITLQDGSTQVSPFVVLDVHS